MKDTAKLGYVSCVDFSDGHPMTFAIGFNYPSDRGPTDAGSAS